MSTPLAFTAWDTENDQEAEDAGQANWRCHGYPAVEGEDGTWTVDVWPDDDGGWAWDVSWGGEYTREEYPYQLGHADSEDGAQEAAQAACAEMEAQRRAGAP